MFIIYKDYPYAPQYTFLSFLAEFGAMLGIAGGIAFIVAAFKTGKYLFLLPGLLLLPIGAVLYFLVYRKIIPAKAEIVSKQNIETKARYAASYCWKHPEAYDQLMQINPDFAAKYTKNEKGRIVRKK